MTSEIRKEAKAYAFRNDGYGYDLNTCEDIFSDGAEWMYEKFEKNRLRACDNQTEKEAEREMNFCDDFIKKHHRIPTISDTIEITRKEMIDKACEWWKENLITPTMTQEGRQWFLNKVNAFRKAMEGGNNENT